MLKIEERNGSAYAEKVSWNEAKDGEAGLRIIRAHGPNRSEWKRLNSTSSMKSTLASLANGDDATTRMARAFCTCDPFCSQTPVSSKKASSNLVIQLLKSHVEVVCRLVHD